MYQSIAFYGVRKTIEIFSSFNLGNNGFLTHVKPASNNVMLMNYFKLNCIFLIYISNPFRWSFKLNLIIDIITTFDNLKNYLIKNDNDKAIDSEKEILPDYELFPFYYFASSSTS